MKTGRGCAPTCSLRAHHSLQQIMTKDTILPLEVCQPIWLERLSLEQVGMGQHPNVPNVVLSSPTYPPHRSDDALDAPNGLRIHLELRFSIALLWCCCSVPSQKSHKKLCKALQVHIFVNISQ